MAMRISQYVVRGELNNSRRNAIAGWIDFGEDYGVRVELVGNFSGDLAGKHFRFETNQKTIRPLPDWVDAMADQQIGVMGTGVLKMARVLLEPVEEAYRRKKAGIPLAEEEKPCLYLEWFSQDGRVVVEIVDPQISYVAPNGEVNAELMEPVEPLPLPEPNAEGGLEITGFRTNQQGDIEEFRVETGEASEDDDPYDLFPADLESRLEESAGPVEGMPVQDENLPRTRSWDEVIPGIDPETKRLYEEWDEVAHGTKDEPLATLFDPPLALRPLEEIVDEEDAQVWLKVLLARLALHSVAVDVCEHFSALDVYRWLLEEILPEAEIHPQLRRTGFVQHYSTWESCRQCAAEFDTEYEEPDGENGRGTNGSEISSPDG